MMAEADGEQLIRVILVALDSSPHSLAALRAAADLASFLDAELLGLYVEDIHLLQIADAHGARQVNFFSDSSPYDRQAAEQQLRAQARQARLALQRLAEQQRLRWSFRTVQGAISAELLAAALDADLIILGKAGWSQRRRLGSTARAVLDQATGPALFLQKGSRLSFPVGVVYDGSENAHRGLAAAARLLHDRQHMLTAIILAADIEAARAYQSEISQWLRPRNLQARYRWIIHPRPDLLRQVLTSEGCGLLVVPAGVDALPAEALEELVNEEHCPVLLVR